MRTVLTRAAIGIGIANFINVFVYYTSTTHSERSFLLLLIWVSLCCGVPIILGYVLSAVLTKSSNTFFYAIAFLLLVFNILLLVIASTIVYLNMLSTPKPFLGCLICLFTGYYVLYKTTHGVQNLKAEPVDFQDNILDDHL